MAADRVWEPTKEGERSGSGLLATVRRDLEHMAGLWDMSPGQRVVRVVGRVILYPRVRAVLWFRVSQLAWGRRIFRPLALAIQAHVIKVSGAELHPAAKIGPGLNLVHSVGVVVGHEVIAGWDLALYQGTTLGHGGRPGQPRLGDRVRIYAGGSVLGGVHVGDDSVVAASAVVVHDVPARHVALGAPAQSRPRTQIAIPDVDHREGTSQV